MGVESVGHPGIASGIRQSSLVDHRNSPSDSRGGIAPVNGLWQGPEAIRNRLVRADAEEGKRQEKTPKEKAKAKKDKKTEESVMNLMKHDRYASPNVVCPAL